MPARKVTPEKKRSVIVCTTLTEQEAQNLVHDPRGPLVVSEWLRHLLLKAHKEGHRIG